MLRNNFQGSARLVNYGFIICVEAEEGTSVDAISLKLADACTWVEGVGHTDVEFMGEIEEVDDDGIVEES